LHKQGMIHTASADQICAVLKKLGKFQFCT